MARRTPPTRLGLDRALQAARRATSPGTFALRYLDDGKWEAAGCVSYPYFVSFSAATRRGPLAAVRALLVDIQDTERRWRSAPWNVKPAKRRGRR